MRYRGLTVRIVLSGLEVSSTQPTQYEIKLEPSFPAKHIKNLQIPRLVRAAEAES